jgi:hypothetical protein
MTIIWLVVAAGAVIAFTRGGGGPAGLIGGITGGPRDQPCPPWQAAMRAALH